MIPTQLIFNPYKFSIVFSIYDTVDILAFYRNRLVYNNTFISQKDGRRELRCYDQQQGVQLTSKLQKITYLTY